MQKLIKNKAQCKQCSDIIESKYRHDFKKCKCGSIFIDGGIDYVRIGYNKEGDYIDLCEYVEN